MNLPCPPFTFSYKALYAPYSQCPTSPKHFHLTHTTLPPPYHIPQIFAPFPSVPVCLQILFTFFPLSILHPFLSPHNIIHNITTHSFFLFLSFFLANWTSFSYYTIWLLQVEMALAVELALDLHVGHASSSGESVQLIASLHLTFARSKGLLDLQPYTRCLVPATFPSCCCIYQLMIVVRLLSQLLMRLRLVSGTPFMAVSPTFLPYNNRYTYK